MLGSTGHRSRARATLGAVRLSILGTTGLALALLAAPRAAADSAQYSTRPTKPSTSGVYVIGDSITAMGAPMLNLRRPDWHINGVAGRHVQALGEEVAAVLAVDPTPRAIVVALGTNRAPDALDDYDTVYRDALTAVPAATRLLLVTPYRNRELWGAALISDDRLRAYHAYHYARAMHDFAEARPRTCIAGWRARMNREPWRLFDGVHPKWRGRLIWARMVAESLDRCAWSAQ